MRSGDGDNVHELFRCGKKKLECRGSQNCKHEKKANDIAVNNQDVIASKFEELKEAVRKRKEGILLGDSNHEMKRDVLRSWDVLLGEEGSHDRNVFDWAFQQEGRVSIKSEKKLIKHDTIENNVHVHNQSWRRNCNKKL